MRGISLVALAGGSVCFSAYAQAIKYNDSLSPSLFHAAMAGDKVALRLLKGAAGEGFPGAETWLGVYYGTNHHYHRADFWTKRAALAGNRLAEFAYGGAFYYGNGVSKNLPMAAYWYRLSAMQGFQPAKDMLEKIHQRMAAQTPAHTQTGSGSKLRAISTTDDGQQHLPLAQAHHHIGTAMTGSLAPLHLTAKQESQLGYDYFYGKGRSANPVRAVYWFRKAAASGNASAEDDLGVAYYVGQGLAQSYQKAVYWYRRSAASGSVDAKVNLGVAYYQGHGVPHDVHMARYWWRQAARQGSDEARRYLAGT
jgi:TPR repeat protein